MKRRTALLAGVAAAAIGLAAFAVVRWRAHALPPPPTKAALDALRAERDALQAKGREAVIAAGERSLARAPMAGIMIGIPTSFTRSIVEQVVTGLFGETTLTLKNLKVHKEGKLKAKLLIKKRTLGEYVLDLKIDEVQGILKPGKPTLAFGNNTIDIGLPVRLAEGRGHADAELQVGQQGDRQHRLRGHRGLAGHHRRRGAAGLLRERAVRHLGQGGDRRAAAPVPGSRGADLRGPIRGGLEAGGGGDPRPAQGLRDRPRQGGRQGEALRPPRQGVQRQDPPEDLQAHPACPRA